MRAIMQANTALLLNVNTSSMTLSPIAYSYYELTGGYILAQSLIVAPYWISNILLMLLIQYALVYAFSKLVKTIKKW